MTCWYAFCHCSCVRFFCSAVLGLTELTHVCRVKGINFVALWKLAYLGLLYNCFVSASIGFSIAMVFFTHWSQIMLCVCCNFRLL